MALSEAEFNKIKKEFCQACSPGYYASGVSVETLERILKKYVPELTQKKSEENKNAAE